MSKQKLTSVTSKGFSGSILNETDEEEEISQEDLFQSSKQKREAFKNTKISSDVSNSVKI